MLFQHKRCISAFFLRRAHAPLTALTIQAPKLKTTMEIREINYEKSDKIILLYLLIIVRFRDATVRSLGTKKLDYAYLYKNLSFPPSF